MVSLWLGYAHKISVLILDAKVLDVGTIVLRIRRIFHSMFCLFFSCCVESKDPKTNSHTAAIQILRHMTKCFCTV